MSGVQLRLSGVKAHSSLGIGELLHDPFHRIYRKIRHCHANVPPRMVLKVAIKAMNDTIGENGIVPSRLVFGILPIFPIISTKLPTQRERMAALPTAQAEMHAIIAERRITSALTPDIPPAVDRHYRLGEEVLVFSEKEKAWLGQFIVLHCTGRMVTVKTTSGDQRQTFNSFHVKPYYKDNGNRLL